MARKKNKKSWTLKIIYAICIIIVFIAGLYYENGYKDINTFINDISNNILKVSTSMQDNNGTNIVTQEISTKKVTGALQMHLIDVGQRR